MRRKGIAVAALVAVAGALAATLALSGGPSSSNAASHREAPLISNDPTADSTDLYAFVSPDKPDTVTIIADYVPFEEPAAGPNWYGFSTSAYYDINIDNTGDAKPDITWRFQFQDTANSHSSALPLGCIASPCQTYSITQIKGDQKSVIVSGYPVAPNDIGPRTFPNGYGPVRAATIKTLPGGGQVFAGPADDPFFGDIGAAFDLVGFRYDLGSKGGGKDAFAGFNVHSIALQVPKTALKGPNGDTIGVWTAASRPEAVVRGNKRTSRYIQVSRLANPLTNELLIPTSLKDQWGGDSPNKDSEYDNVSCSTRSWPRWSTSSTASRSRRATARICWRSSTRVSPA